MRVRTAVPRGKVLVGRVPTGTLVEAPGGAVAAAADLLAAVPRPAAPSGQDGVAAWIRRASAGDEAAARCLMDRLYPLVLKVVRAHLPWRTAEEDLVQTVFMKVFAHLGQYAGAVPLEHWVSRIAVNTCLSALKAEKSRPELRWADLTEEAQVMVESVAAADATTDETQGVAARELVQLLLSRLKPADRLVVTLLHLEEKSVAEVRARTGWSTALVKVRAFRARKRLQKILSQLEQRV